MSEPVYHVDLRTFGKCIERKLSIEQLRELNNKIHNYCLECGSNNPEFFTDEQINEFINLVIKEVRK